MATIAYPRETLFYQSDRSAPRVARERGQAALALLRLGLIVFAAYAGSLVVCNVTHALCVATGQHPPAWTVR